MLTLERILDNIELRVQTHGVIDPVDLANEAGHFFCNLFAWPWLNRPSTSLSFVADQPWVDLPADFANLTGGPAMVDSLVSSVELTGLDEIVRRRNLLETSALHYYVALEYPPQNDTASPASGARLAIFPTPSATAADQMHITYRAGWRRLTRLDDAANIPDDCNSAMLQIARLHARGYEAELAGKGTLASLLDGIEETSMFKRLIRKYALDQDVEGPMEGGILQGRGDDTPYRPYTTIGGHLE